MAQGVEAEQLGQERVVHNYGHGGSGVRLPRGCARQAVALLVEQESDENRQTFQR